MRFIDATGVAALGPVAAVKAIADALRGGLDPATDPARVSVDLTKGPRVLLYQVVNRGNGQVTIGPEG